MQIPLITWKYCNFLTIIFCFISYSLNFFILFLFEEETGPIFRESLFLIAKFICMHFSTSHIQPCRHKVFFFIRSTLIIANLLWKHVSQSHLYGYILYLFVFKLEHLIYARRLLYITFAILNKLYRYSYTLLYATARF